MDMSQELHQYLNKNRLVWGEQNTISHCIAAASHGGKTMFAVKAEVAWLNNRRSQFPGR